MIEFLFNMLAIHSFANKPHYRIIKIKYQWYYILNKNAEQAGIKNRKKRVIRQPMIKCFYVSFFPISNENLPSVVWKKLLLTLAM